MVSICMFLRATDFQNEKYSCQFFKCAVQIPMHNQTLEKFMIENSPILGKMIPGSEIISFTWWRSKRAERL